MTKRIPANRAFRAIRFATVGGACTLAATFAGTPPAHAQSSVTLYGITDASILYTSRTSNLATGASEGHQFSVESAGENASRFGLHGREDLGGGLAAIFDLESGIDISNGGFANSNGEFFGRQAWVGVTGSFGTLTAGLQYSPFLLSIDANDPRDLKQFGSGLINYVDNVIVTGLFNPNSVMYTSPEIAGIQGRAMYAFGGSPGNFKAGQQYSAGLSYHFSGLLLTSAMYSGNSGGSAAAIPNPSAIAFSGRNIGASYNFNRLTVKAAYTLYKVAGAFDSRVISGGLAFSLTPALSLNGGAWYTRDGNDSNNHSILGSLGVDYALSKRTTLYSQLAYVDNHGRMNTGLAINGALFGLPGSQFAADLGIRHLF
ncbi:porin [Trinickia sp. YCB016]